jgi:hypothetical protein
MKWTKEVIQEYIDNWKEDQEYIIEKTTTKAGRSQAQNRTFWKIFKGIGDKLWYSKEIVRTNILTALFWTYEVQMFWSTHLIANKTSTATLTKEEGIQVIDGALAYATKIDAGITITPREITSLYESFN